MMVGSPFGHWGPTTPPMTAEEDFSWTPSSSSSLTPPQAEAEGSFAAGLYSDQGEPSIRLAGDSHSLTSSSALSLDGGWSVEEKLDVEPGNWMQESRRRFKLTLDRLNVFPGTVLEIDFITNDERLSPGKSRISILEMTCKREGMAMTVSGTAAPYFTTRKPLLMCCQLRLGEDVISRLTHKIPKVFSRNKGKVTKAKKKNEGKGKSSDAKHGNASDLFDEPPVEDYPRICHWTAGYDWWAVTF